MPDTALPTNSSGDAPEIRVPSTVDLMLQVFNELRTNHPKHHWNVVISRVCGCISDLSIPNIVVLTNSASDAPEIGFPSVTLHSTEVKVSMDSPSAELSNATVMSPADCH